MARMSHKLFYLVWQRFPYNEEQEHFLAPCFLDHRPFTFAYTGVNTFLVSVCKIISERFVEFSVVHYC